MMDVDSTSLPPPRLPGRVMPNNNNNNSATTIELSAASRSSFLAGKMLRGADVVQSRSYGKEDATTAARHNRPVNAVGRRDNASSHGYDAVQEAVLHVPAGRDRETSRKEQTRGHQLQIPSSKSNSQDTVMTNDVGDDIFTPAASAGGLSRTNSKSSGQDSSSQESQLQQLSQIAAAQEKLNTAGDSDGGNDQKGGQSRKRMADGMVKSASEGATASPAPKGGHSRNASTVSVASSAGSRLGELSAELKTRLSYAMIKVNNGWQSHTIDQVETLASQATSPTSSNSTIHFRQGASASPQISTPSYRGSNNATPVTALHQQFAPRLSDTRNPVPTNPPSSSTATRQQQPTLAPPISIEPSQHVSNPRRTANQRHTPTLAGQSNLVSPSTAPHTPGQPSPYPGAQEQRTPQVDPMIFSPHQTPQQNVREQDAMEALLFMSSPGNSANLKHTFPSSSQPVNRGSRTALPGSQPRKSLPSGRPVANPVPHPYGPSKAGQPQGAQPKRVGFEPAGATAINNPAPYASPYPPPSSAASRKPNTADHPRAANDGRNATTARLKRLPLSAGLSVPSVPRPKLADADIDRMLDSVAAEDSSDSEGEIIIPVRPQQRREEIPAGAR